MGLVNKLKRLWGYLKDDTIERIQAYERGDTILSYKPVLSGIELTNVCNLRCTFCNREPMIKRGLGFMDPKKFKRLIEEQEVGYVQLYHHGESLLHPKFNEILKIVRDHDLECHIVTNISAMTEDKIREMIKTFKRVCFSFDAPTKEYFETLRVGAKYDDCVEKIEHFCKLNEEAGHPVQTEINIVMTDEVKKHMRKFVERWANIVDLIQFTKLVDWGGQKDVSDLGEAREEEKRVCASPWCEIYVLWDGTVYPCCTWEPMDGKGMGNIFEQSLEEIWNGEKYQEFRRRHAEGDLKGTFCEKCKTPWRSLIPKDYYYNKHRKLMILGNALKYLFKKLTKHKKSSKNWSYKGDVWVETKNGMIKNDESKLA